jgi:hypothetical protein
MNKYFVIPFIILSFITANLSLAYAIRPLYTERSSVTPIGKAVLETGILLLTGRDNSGIHEITTTIKYGLSNNLDIRLDLPYMTRLSTGGNYDGMSYGSFKLKYNFAGEAANDGLGAMLGYQINNADQNANSDPRSHNITTILIYSKNLNDINYHFNFGYTFDDEQGSKPQNDFILYNIAATKQLNDNIDIVGELQYSKNTETLDIFGETALGMIYRYSEALAFDAAIGCGLNENSSSNNLAFGATLYFN